MYRHVKNAAFTPFYSAEIAMNFLLQININYNYLSKTKRRITRCKQNHLKTGPKSSIKIIRPKPVYQSIYQTEIKI